MTNLETMETNTTRESRNPHVKNMAHIYTSRGGGWLKRSISEGGETEKISQNKYHKFFHGQIFKADDCIMFEHCL